MEASLSKRAAEWSNRRVIALDNPVATRRLNLGNPALRSHFDKVIVTHADNDETVSRLSHSLEPGDIVATNTGDGGVNSAVEAVIEAGLEDSIAIAPLGRGNFNDHHKIYTLSSLHHPVETYDFFPLDLKVLDGKNREIHHSHPSLYITLGMMATVADTFSDPDFRNFLQKHPHTRLAQSLIRVAKLYGSLRQQNIPPHQVEAKPWNIQNTPSDITDLVIGNNPRVARLAKTPDHRSSPENFSFAALDYSEVVTTALAGIRAITSGVPVSSVNQLSIKFDGVLDLPVHADGNVEVIESAKQFIVSKHPKSIKFIR